MSPNAGSFNLLRCSVSALHELAARRSDERMRAHLPGERVNERAKPNPTRAGIAADIAATDIAVSLKLDQCPVERWGVRAGAT
jgi:hypothetical protein